MIHRIPFTDDQPSKTVKEAVEKRKNKTVEVINAIGDKSSDLANKIDQKMLRSKTFAGFWKKLKGTSKEEEESLQKRIDEEEEKRTDMKTEGPPDDMSHDDQ